MARAPQVEFPGKKRQRVRMRGTKHANEDTAKRLRRSLDRLLEHPERALPELTGSVRRGWRRDPIERTMKEIDLVVQRRGDTAWLKKRMLAKRGDHIAKALAGSFHAAHDVEISTVGKYQNSAFGTGSYIRRGDGKQAYLASLQNHNNVTLRMLAWEEHARRGLHFFSWSDGFVCTGRDTTPPEGWLEDVLERSRFTFTTTAVEGVTVHHTEGIDPAVVAADGHDNTGYIRLAFHHGPIVAIDLDAVGTAGEKDKAFVHHLAMSMLPPILPRLVDVEARWSPHGWPEERPLPEGCMAGMDRLLDAWQGLTLNEGVLGGRLKAEVLTNLDHGLVLEDRWSDGVSVDDVVEQLAGLGGSEDEAVFAAAMLTARMAVGGGIIDTRGELRERDEGALLVTKGASLNAIMGALWADHHEDGLVGLGLSGDDLDAILASVDGRPKSFGAFLRGLDDARAAARREARFPHRRGQLSGPLGLTHDLVLTGLLDGGGRAQKVACDRHDDVEEAAAAWAWLLAADRHTGQEWHFEPVARDRGGAWSTAARALIEAGTALLEDGDDGRREAFAAALADLAVTMGVAAP
ncbi:MAG: hypothetical protein ACPGK0_06300 [Candidatus Poseidoniaceae archaeon]